MKCLTTLDFRKQDKLMPDTLARLQVRSGAHRLSIRLADSFFSRLRGLLFAPALQPGQGLLIRPCAAVHTAFMAYPIDVVFLDRVGRVRRIVPGLEPWRVARYSGAWQTLELAAGEAARIGLRAGQLLCPEPGTAAQENLA